MEDEKIVKMQKKIIDALSKMNGEELSKIWAFILDEADEERWADNDDDS